VSKDNRNVLVLGGNGLLGSQLLSGRYLGQYKCLKQSRDIDADIQVDLQDINQVHGMLKALLPFAVVNLVALTNVDTCQESPDKAYRVNVKPLENIMQACKSLSISPRLIHISTDQLYDGLGPHKEDEIKLTNFYAFSKYSAELVASSMNSVILRTNFFGKSLTPRRKSFTDWLYEELSAEKKIYVFEDVLFSPLSMHRLCEVIEQLLESNLNGIYNLGTLNGFSKADFAFQFAEILGLPKNKMIRTKTSKVDFINTYRPKDMRMNVSALERAIMLKLPNLSSEIENIAQDYLR
jgi:dTDP-4-dehydrorhamnose reductase